MNSGYHEDKGIDGMPHYINPTPGELPIFASTVWEDAKTAIPEKVLNDMKECGFNVASCTQSFSVLSATLENAKAVGVKLLLGHSWLNEGKKDEECIKDPLSCVEKFIEKYKSNSAVGGWSLDDEPSFSKIEDTTRPNSLFQRYHKIWALDKTHLIYINLPGAPSEKFMPENSYDEYLQKFQENFGPQLWSYDLYPISQNNFLLTKSQSGTNGAVSVNRSRFYEDFEIFSAKARETGVPFWAYCQSVENAANANYYAPMALEQYLRYEAFSALAYGAQGLVYWTYRERNYGSIDENNKIDYSDALYLSAPRNRENRITPYWHFARQVNSEIRRFQEVFLGSKLQAAYHTEKTFSLKSKFMPSPFGPIQKIVSSGDGVLVSHLRTNGKDFLVIVNHDPLSHQEIVFTFLEDAELWELTPYYSNGGEPGKITESHDEVSRNLIPGGYIIFQWMNPK